MKNAITVESIVSVSRAKVWELFNQPEHIVQWGSSSPDWHTTEAKNDLVVGGTLEYRMEAKDGSEGFNLVGTYSEVIPNEKLAYALGDGRKVEVIFAEEGEQTHITEMFEPETENSIEMQRGGWQAILDSFKAYAEKQ